MPKRQTKKRSNRGSSLLIRPRHFPARVTWPDAPLVDPADRRPTADAAALRHAIGTPAKLHGKVRAEAALRYRSLKIRDPSAPGHFSYAVFDITQQDKHGLFTYVADCLSARTARFVCDALNAYTAARSLRNSRDKVRS